MARKRVSQNEPAGSAGPPARRIKGESEESSDETASSGTIEFVLKKVSSWKNNAYRFSANVEVQGISWQTKAIKSVANDSLRLEVYLGAFNGLPDALSSTLWSLEVTGRFTVINQNKAKHFTKVLNPVQFTHDKQWWGFMHLLDWKNVIDPDQGVIKEDNVVIKADFTIIRIDGLRQNPDFDFEDADPRHDLVVMLGDKRLHASRQFLAIHSPVLNSMLFGNYAESKKKEVTLQGVEYEDFKEMLQVMYPCGKKITDANAPGLLKVGDYLQIKVLLDQVEKYLLDSSTMTTAAKLKLAGDYRLAMLQGRCLSSFKTYAELKDIKKTEEWEGFSEATKAALLERFMKISDPPNQ